MGSATRETISTILMNQRHHKKNEPWTASSVGQFVEHLDLQITSFHCLSWVVLLICSSNFCSANLESRLSSISEYEMGKGKGNLEVEH